jgi:hypothetical protein
MLAAMAEVTQRVGFGALVTCDSYRNPTLAGRKSGILDNWCQRVGRDPNEIERSIRPNRIENAYVENGIIHLMLGFTGPDYDLAPLEELIARRDSRNGG